MDYQSAGVNIDKGNEAVNLIKDSVKKTHNRSVLSSIGGFAAGFALDKNQYEEPILVSCTDGVGTKLKIAIECDKVDTIGIDLVAMCVNDMICMGAKPLFFLDYYACHELSPSQVKSVIDGIVEGCIESGAALIGGEMAEMNDMYKKGDFDLAGFSVGIVDKAKIIDGSKIESGHYIYGLPSSGIHSNGYSLVRKVLTQETCKRLNIDQSELLTPTRIYVNQIQQLINKYTITGISHITGGGIAENCERVLPVNCKLIINKQAIKIPGIFSIIQQEGSISEEEMMRVFNMGIGMIVISPDEIEESKDLIKIGVVQTGDQGVEFI